MAFNYTPDATTGVVSLSQILLAIEAYVDANKVAMEAIGVDAQLLSFNESAETPNTWFATYSVRIPFVKTEGIAGAMEFTPVAF